MANIRIFAKTLFYMVGEGYYLPEWESKVSCYAQNVCYKIRDGLI